MPSYRQYNIVNDLGQLDCRVSVADYDALESIQFWKTRRPLYKSPRLWGREDDVWVPSLSVEDAKQGVQVPDALRWIFPEGYFSEPATVEANDLKRDSTQKIVDKLSKLSNWQGLIFVDSQLNDKDVKQFESQTRLQLLQFRLNPVSDESCESIGKFTSIQYLDLGYTEITDEGIAKLGGLHQLKELYFDGTEIDGSGFRGWTPNLNVTMIDISNTRVNFAGLDAIKRAFPNAEISRDFGYYRKPLYEILPLAGLTSLSRERVFWPPARKLQERDYQAIAKCETLESLDLSFDSINDQQLEFLVRSLPKLDYVNVSHCSELTDKALEILVCNDIERIWISQDCFSQKALELLKESKHWPRFDGYFRYGAD